jgi:EAL domain-containing protein (putative c-di-GMP-specific phosphodiesterase class I)
MLTNTSPYLLQLEGKTAKGGEWTIPIEGEPFAIGRMESCNLRLNGGGVSRRHAEIHRNGKGWCVTDCDSTNGTYLNGERITDCSTISPGDILQFAMFQFTVAPRRKRREHAPLVNPHARSFERMMRDKAVTPYFQPIVRFADQATVAHEILGRVHYEGLPQDPGELFEIATALDRDIELSQLFRDRGLAQAQQHGLKTRVFFNTLPKEMEISELNASLESVRKAFPNLRLAMELYESAVTNESMIKRIKHVLQALDIYLVYDDFGAGQARLVELIHATPDVIKFDIALIHQIQTRPTSSQAIVAALVKMAREAGIQTLAEGVENREEAEVCRQMGFDLAQGYFFGKPAATFNTQPI